MQRKNAEEVNGVELKVEKVVGEILPIEENMPDTVINTFIDVGWGLNEDLKQLERVVTYQGEEIEVDGEKVKTDSNGEAVFELDNTENVDLTGIIRNKVTKKSQLRDVKRRRGVQVGGLKNGQKHKYGAYVYCNRFNRFTGDGRYYSKSKHPVPATVNFFQSDFDVALAKSNKCLLDYTSKPYCSTKNKTTADRCLPNIVKHSRLYHKHTGWFSPSK